MTPQSSTQLSDRALLDATVRAARDERRTTAELITLLSGCLRRQPARSGDVRVAPVVLVIAALAASYLPARRASRLDVVRALEQE